jgi:cold shock protein
VSVAGVVREWHEEEDWGVVDSPATPGGCWVHSSDVAVSGYRALVAGQRVELEHERVEQDGYAHRATRVWPSGGEPAPPDPPSGPSSAYRSWLSLEDSPDA